MRRLILMTTALFFAIAINAQDNSRSQEDLIKDVFQLQRQVELLPLAELSESKLNEVDDSSLALTRAVDNSSTHPEILQYRDPEKWPLD